MSVRILVVEDNRDTLRSYVRALSRRIKAGGSPLEVEDADTVSLALQKLRSQRFEVLVVDLRIPGLSGEEMGGLGLIDESIQLDPLRRIIVITGYGSVELARKTLTRGVFDFIEKSVTAVDELVEAVQRALDFFDEETLRSGNPFVFMTGVEPSVFGGRTAELAFFEQKLNRTLNTRFCEHFRALGNWGIGKSTLLREYKKMCQRRGHIACVVPLESLQKGTRQIEAARSIVEGIIRDLPYTVDRFKRVMDYFGALGVTVLGTGLQFSKDATRRELNPQAFLHDTFVNLWEDLREETEVLVILLDDLDNFAAVPEIVMTLRQTLSMPSIQQTRILVGLTATSGFWEALTSNNRHHPLARYFMSRVELGPLDKNELQETVFKSVAGTGVSFSQEVVGLVFEYTQGHPFEMQVLCYHLFDNHRARRVGMEVWDKALQSALDDLGVAIFGYWFRLASSEEAKVLRVIAEADTSVAVKDIQEAIKTSKETVSSQSIPKYLQRLVEKQLLNKAGRGLYGIPDPMFRAYIKILAG